MLASMVNTLPDWKEPNAEMSRAMSLGAPGAIVVGRCVDGMVCGHDRGGGQRQIRASGRGGKQKGPRWRQGAMVRSTAHPGVNPIMDISEHPRRAGQFTVKGIATLVSALLFAPSLTLLSVNA